MLDLLSSRADMWGEIRLVASPRSAGRTLKVRGRETKVVALSPRRPSRASTWPCSTCRTRFRGVGAGRGARGAVAVDNSGAFRMDPQVPLIVPEINPEHLARRPKGIVANPNCTTLSMIVAVGALHGRSAWGIIVSSYQAASGAGQAGIETLYAQLDKVAGTASLGQRAGDVRAVVGDLGPFPAPLAMNVVPWAGVAQGQTAGRRRSSRSATRAARSSACPRCGSPRPACGCRSSPRTRSRCTRCSPPVSRRKRGRCLGRARRRGHR